VANVNEGQSLSTVPIVDRSSPLLCWRCQCVIPKDFLRQRVVSTSSSRGTHVVVDAKVSIAGFYEIVNLCSTCAEEFTTRKKAKLDARALRESWWGRLVLGACFVAMLSSIRQPLTYSILLVFILDRLRVLGPAVLLMGIVFLGEYLVGLRPHRFHRRIRIPWQIIISMTLLWGVYHTPTLQRIFSWMGRRCSSTVVTAVSAPECSSLVETNGSLKDPRLAESDKS
jgi:hypothetical protein